MSNAFLKVENRVDNKHLWFYITFPITFIQYKIKTNKLIVYYSYSSIDKTKLHKHTASRQYLGETMPQPPYGTP